MLTNPIYGGGYAFGRTKHGTRLEGGQPRKRIRRRAWEEWISLIPSHHEGYISWEQFEQIQAVISGNNNRADRPGAAKRGPALLAGLLRCGRCGRKVTVTYTGGGPRYLRYCCVRGYLDVGEPKCISLGGVPVDQALSREVLRVCSPRQSAQRSRLPTPPAPRPQPAFAESLPTSPVAQTTDASDNTPPTQYREHCVVWLYNTRRSHMVREHLPPVREKPEEVVAVDRNEVVVRSYVGGLVNSFERRAA